MLDTKSESGRYLFQSSQLSEVKECLRVAADQEESLRRLNDEYVAKVSKQNLCYANNIWTSILTTHIA